MASSPSRHLAAPTSRPTIAGEAQNGRELTHYAPSPTQGLTIVTSAIERWMKQAVTAEIKRQKESESQQNDRQQEVPAPTTSEYFNDDMVRRLMLRMHDLAQEDRFRMGRIR
jgi:hypothetical protein